MINEIGKALAICAIVMLVLGVMLQYGTPVPWLRWVGKLPGDVRVSFSHFQLLLPIGSCLLVSLVLTLFWQLFGRLR